MPLEVGEAEMSKEILDAVHELEAQKGIDAEVLLVALEEALRAAYKKTPGAGRHARVVIDRETGDFRVLQIDTDDDTLEDLGLLTYPEPEPEPEVPIEPERPRRERPAFYERADQPEPEPEEPDPIIAWDRLAEHGINVYEVRPGVIATDMTSGVQSKYDQLIDDGLTPIRRWGRPDDVARAVVAIADGSLPFSTGEIINVDGGFHMHRL